MNYAFSKIWIVIIAVLIIAGGILTWQLITEEDEEELAITEDWSCGDSVTFTYKGSSVTYGTVESQGKCWLDRNLGASRVATAYDDEQAYGDLFQWGRLDDGHQDRSSGTTDTLSTTDVPGHSNFIYTMDSSYDWRSPRNDNLWQGVSGINNPCPDGWRLPTDVEWENESKSWSEQNSDGAYRSPLKLTGAGGRARTTASLQSEGWLGGYWSSSVSDTSAFYLTFGNSICGIDKTSRAHGLSVRCIKN